jgi:two-component system cell cycle response regulator DivK
MHSDNKILIIDDSNTNVVLLEAILGKRGFLTQTAFSVKEAMPKILKSKPAMIILDLLMPEISGYDFLKDIKSNEKYREIPIVVVSALTDYANIERTINLGAIDFIKKPIDIEILVKTVESILKTS